MMKEVIRALEVGSLSEVALFAFIVAFVSASILMAAYTKSQRSAAKNLPLDDGTIQDAFVPKTPGS
ncbi:MAG: hypothetical protein JNN12_10355 [Bacteroidetes Order II. Incertae sedis bacterium]|nr:hypothetical protein [Bacteroidetes Order II. bacterium]